MSIQNRVIELMEEDHIPLIEEKVSRICKRNGGYKRQKVKGEDAE